MSDLESGSGPWVNIAQVVRQTFLAIHDKIRSQNERIRNVERMIVEERKERKEQIENISHDTLTRRGSQAQDRDSVISSLQAQVKELQNVVAELSESIPKKDDMQRILVKKVDTRTLEAVLDQFPDRNEMTASIEDSYHNLETKFEVFKSKVVNELTHVKVSKDAPEELEFLRSTVTCEMLIGRWLWQTNRSGPVKLKESVNTAQILYEQEDESVIRVTKRGLFELQFACFMIGDSPQQSTVVILVDGEPILSNQSLPLKSHSTTKSSNISSLRKGWSIVEFLLLEPGSEISVHFSGERARGFLGLRNLQCEDE